MDIVERLRNAGDHAHFIPHLHHKAADEIEKLRADVDRMASVAIDNARDMLRLREALREIDKGINQWLHDGSYIKRALLKISSAALKEAE